MIKLVNFNISTILDYGYCSHLYAYNKLINQKNSYNLPIQGFLKTPSVKLSQSDFLKTLNCKYTPNFIDFPNFIKLNIRHNKINFLSQNSESVDFLTQSDLYKNLSGSLSLSDLYKKIYINNFYNFINVIPNFIKIYNYLINKDILIAYTFYHKDLYNDKVFEYQYNYLSNKNILPHLYHKSYNINHTINHYSNLLNIKSNEILNVDNDLLNLLNTNVKNVGIISGSGYIGVPYIHFKLIEINDNKKYLQLYNFSKNILKNSKSDYIINDVNNIMDII